MDPQAVDGLEPEEGGFERLLKGDPAGVTEPPGTRRGAPWLLIVSIGATLIGAGGIIATILFIGGAGAATRAETAAPPAEASAPREIPPARAETAKPGIDEEWLGRVAAHAGIPERALLAYAEAAARTTEEAPNCGLGWNTLAAIGLVESEHGMHGDSELDDDGRASPPIIGVALDGAETARIPDTDDGTLDDDPHWDRAVGPMQFIPSTWAVWGSDGNGDGVADPQQIDDAAYSAARYLCATGGNLQDPGRWIAAVAAYNDTVEYNHRVAEAASRYADLAG